MVRKPWHLIGSYEVVCRGRQGLSACLNPSEALLEQDLMEAETTLSAINNRNLPRCDGKAKQSQ